MEVWGAVVKPVFVSVFWISTWLTGLPEKTLFDVGGSISYCFDQQNGSLESGLVVLIMNGCHHQLCSSFPSLLLDGIVLQLQSTRCRGWRRETLSNPSGGIGDGKFR